MHHRIRVLTQIALLLITLLAASVPSAAQSLPAKSLAIELDRSSSLVPTGVTYRWTERGLEIKGRIEKRRDRYGRILGHVEIDLLNSEGRILARHSDALEHFSPRRQNPKWAFFRTVIKTDSPNAAQIRVRHAVGPWQSLP